MCVCVSVYLSIRVHVVCVFACACGCGCGCGYVCVHVFACVLFCYVLFCIVLYLVSSPSRLATVSPPRCVSLPARGLELGAEEILIRARRLYDTHSEATSGLLHAIQGRSSLSYDVDARVHA
jgi:hypothetical protein